MWPAAARIWLCSIEVIRVTSGYWLEYRDNNARRRREKQVFLTEFVDVGACINALKLRKQSYGEERRDR